jgi:hypothetical protein
MSEMNFKLFPNQWFQHSICEAHVKRNKTYIHTHYPVENLAYYNKDLHNF